MKRMFWWAGLFAATVLTAAPTPAPGQLLPADTLGMASVPDWAAFQSAWQKTPFGLLWQDPAMTPFREKTLATFREKVLGEMEKGLGVKSDDFLPLLQGQVTVAVVAGDWKPSDSESEPSLVLVVDSKDHADALKARLAEVRQKLADAKKPVKTTKIRDIEFTTVTVDPAALKGDAAKGEKAGDKKEEDEDGDGEKAKPGKVRDWTFGQVDSVLLLSDSPKPLEKIVARLAGGSVGVIGDLPEYAAGEKAVGFATAHLFAWVNTAMLVNSAAATLGADKGATGPMGLDMQKVLKSLGLDGLKMVSFSGVFGTDRQTSTFAAASAESGRSGLVKMLQFPAKDSAPTPLVPLDAVRFHRLRLDAQKTWNSLESMLASMSPQLNGFLQLTLGSLGKDKDAGFDFHKTFVGNLGDDFISYDKPARGKSPAELANAPSVSLIGAADAEQLLTGFRAAAALLPTGGQEPKTREVNGHKVFQYTLSGSESPPIEATAAGGYVAIANDPGAIDEFLRNDGSGKSLRDQPALAELAQLVGGTGTGLFGYSDDKEYTRVRWEAMRAGLEESVGPAGKKTTSNFDFKLLPPFDAISHYFGRSVFSGAWDADGFKMKAVSIGSH